MTGTLAQAIDEDVRLIILKELAAMPDGRSNETILAEAVYACGHNRSRDYLRTQLHKLAELGATRNTSIGSIVVAQITEAGVDHCLRRTRIEGIRQPRLGA